MTVEELNELLNALAATPIAVQSVIENLPDQQLREQPASGDFSLVENVCHLRDIEVEAYAPRIKRILTEEHPLLPDVDGGQLAIDREYHKQNISEALHAFAQARSKNIGTLAILSAEQLRREGTLAGMGNITLGELLLLLRNHDAEHVKQMADVRWQMSDGRC